MILGWIFLGMGLQAGIHGYISDEPAQILSGTIFLMVSLLSFIISNATRRNP